MSLCSNCNFQLGQPTLSVTSPLDTSGTVTWRRTCLLFACIGCYQWPLHTPCKHCCFELGGNALCNYFVSFLPFSAIRGSAAFWCAFQPWPSVSGSPRRDGASAVGRRAADTRSLLHLNYYHQSTSVESVWIPTNDDGAQLTSARRSILLQIFLPDFSSE